jgi:hypothetical protein
VMHFAASHAMGKKHRFEVRRAIRAYDQAAACDFCGESVNAPSWRMNEIRIPQISEGAVKCISCVHTDWDDFAHAVGANPNTGILHVD